MSVSTTVASLPYAEEGNEQRASRNFAINHIAQDGKLIWHIISKMGDEDITFDVREKGVGDENPIRFENVKEGMVIPYQGLRNLYIANPKNATGHFLVRVETYEEAVE